MTQLLTAAFGRPGVPVPQFLLDGWAQARPVALRTLQRAFAEQLTAGERAYWTVGEQGRRAVDVYLTRPWTYSVGH